MAESVNNVDLFGSGGHVWAWDQPEGFSKRVQTVGVAGAAQIRTAVGPRICRIVGRDGSPACLIGKGADIGAADAALDEIERAIEDLRDSGLSCPWVDDAGRNGSALVVAEFRRVGPRTHGPGSDGQYQAWQWYVCELVELTGAID